MVIETSVSSGLHEDKVNCLVFFLFASCQTVPTIFKYYFTELLDTNYERFGDFPVFSFFAMMSYFLTPLHPPFFSSLKSRSECEQGDEGKWGRWHGVPCRSALFMCGAVQTHNLWAPVGLPGTVAAKEPHYCHRGHILFGAKLGLESLLFFEFAQAHWHTYLFKQGNTITCRAEGLLEAGAEWTQRGRETSPASWETFKIRHRAPFPPFEFDCRHFFCPM